MQGQATAVDTPFAECSEEECTVLLDDDKIELQRVTIDIPAGSDVTGAESCCHWVKICYARSWAPPEVMTRSTRQTDCCMFGGLHDRACVLAVPEVYDH